MKTISEKLQHKKYKKPNALIHSVYKFIAMNIAYPKANIQLHKEADLKDCKGPCFIIYNHLSRADHASVLKATYPRPYNMVAGRNEFYRNKFSFVFGLENVIPKRNYFPDMLTIKGISQAINSGSCVAFAPEGLASNDGMNKPIVPGTSKMFKHYKIPVYLIRHQGNYLYTTKCCLDERIGETHATLSLLFTPEDIERLSVEEMDNIINEKFRNDEYEWQKKQHIKWIDPHHRMADGLEYLCYRCPKCGAEFEMSSNGDELVCKKCGNGAHINEYYEFEPYKDSVIPESPAKWANMERLEIIDAIRKDKNYKFEDDVELGNLDENKPIKDPNVSCYKTGTGKLSVDHSGLHYKGTRYGQEYSFDLDWNAIYTTFTVTDASNFSFYIKGEYFEIKPLHKTTFKFHYLIEEMHRLHINYYKNFPWFDYMYEGKVLGIDNKE